MPEPTLRTTSTTNEEGVAQVWLYSDDGGCASFGFDEVLREGAALAMQTLRAQGYQLSLLSGDSTARAAQLAQQLHLHAVLGAATPADKLAEVGRGAGAR